MLSVARGALDHEAAAAPHREWQTLAAAIATAALGMAMAFVGGISLVLLLAGPVLVVVVLRPAFGAYLFLFANPLIVGIARGDTIPLVRPNELLMALLLLALAIRVPARILSGITPRPSVNAVDIALLGLVVTGSLLPPVWREIRSLPLTLDDILYAIVLCKYLALYWFFRQSVTTRQQVLGCLVASLSSGAIVAVVAMLQVNKLFGVPEFLFQVYDSPFTGFEGPVTGRGTSTIASSFGTADVMIINLLICLALLKALQWRSWLLGGAAVVFLAGTIAAGAFSGFIGLGIALITFAVIARQLGRLFIAGLPVMVLAVMLFWPVVAGRLAGFDRPSGLPRSWEGRLANLRDFFLPEIFSGTNWLTGVRPAARVPAPEPWRDWVYIESGYVWLMWIGGLPFLLAFGCLVAVAAGWLWPLARHRDDAHGSVAAVTLSYLVLIAALMLLDPHLTVRGSADLFFPLLALAMLRPADRDQPTSTVAAARGAERRCELHPRPARPARRPVGPTGLPIPLGAIR